MVGCVSVSTFTQLPEIAGSSLIQYPFSLMYCVFHKHRKTSNIRHTLVGNKIVDHSDVVGASPVGAAPTTSSFSTWHLALRIRQRKPQDSTIIFKCWDLVRLILETWRYLFRQCLRMARPNTHNNFVTVEDYRISKMNKLSSPKQSYDCPSACEANLNNSGKLIQVKRAE